VRVANIIEEGKLGGPQVRICAIATALVGLVDTTVIMPKENSETFQQRCDTCGVAYITMPITRVTKDWRVAVRYVFFSLFEVLHLAWVLKKNRFDLVHVSGGSWQFKGVLAAKLAGKKVLWHLNDTSMPRFIRRLFSTLSPLADAIIYASVRSQNYYKPLVNCNKQDFLIPAPVDTDKFNPSREYSGEEQLIQRWQGKLVIGTVANINPVKGLETLIHAAALTSEKNFNVQFVVIGSIYPTQQQYYNSLISLCEQLHIKNIEFVGSRSDVRPLLKRFDLYVCSSNAESSPISVWESMSMAKPIISTDVGDVTLYVKDGVNGFIVNIGDSEALAERMGHLIAEESLRKDFGSRSRDVAVQELELSRCAERHLEAYNAVFEQ